MQKGSLLETSKFALVALVVFLVVTVPILLLQPTQISKNRDTQAEILRAMAPQKTVSGSKELVGGTVYRFPDGGSLVFTDYAFGQTRLACAVLFNANLVVQSVRSLAPLVPPFSIQTENLLARAAAINSTVLSSTISPQERAISLDILALLQHAADLAKKAGTS